MQKSQLVGEVAARSGLSRTDAAGAADAVIGLMAKARARREQVRIAGVGLIATRYRPARSARNPRRGEPVTVAAWAAPTLKPARALCETVTGGACSWAGRVCGARVRHLSRLKTLPNAQGA